MKNTVILIGRVGNEPELKDVGTSKVCTISLATTEKWKDKEGNKKEETQWHTLKVWGAMADNAHKYVKKGDVFSVDGAIKYRKYTDKDGVERYATEIVVSEMVLLPNKEKAAQ